MPQHDSGISWKSLMEFSFTEYSSLFAIHGPNDSRVREYWIVDPGNRCVTVKTPSRDGKFGKAAL